MRPKKTILIVSQSEEQRSNLCFKLGIRQYSPKSVGTEAEALALLTTSQFHLMILNLPLTNTKELLASARSLDCNMRTLLLVPRGTLAPPQFYADAIMPMHEGAFSEVLERIRILVKCRRGPKKGVRSISSADLDAGKDVAA